VRHHRLAAMENVEDVNALVTRATFPFKLYMRRYPTWKTSARLRAFGSILKTIRLRHAQAKRESLYGYVCLVSHPAPIHV
jgi:hypothetical protein